MTFCTTHMRMREITAAQLAVEASERHLVLLHHRVRRGGVQGDAHSIVVDGVSAVIHGVADRRRATAKAAGD